MPEPEVGIAVGQRMYARRKRLQLTQARLAALTGMTQGSIARIETGKAKEVESSTLIALARALGVSTDWLLGLAPEDEEDEAHAVYAGR
jgi:transcriptional regulator with XRE-family HTH domain